MTTNTCTCIAQFKGLPHEAACPLANSGLRDIGDVLNYGYSPRMPIEGIREHAILICDDCRELKGDVCHNPDCVFCRKSITEVARCLNVLGLFDASKSPLVNREVEFTYYGSQPEFLGTRQRGRIVRGPDQIEWQGGTVPMDYGYATDVVVTGERD